MRRWLTLGAAVLLPIFCGLLAGCSDDYVKQRRKGTGTLNPGEGGPGKQVALSELDSNGWGKVKGRFVSKDAPKLPPLTAVMEKHNDRSVCLNAPPLETQDQTWITSPNGGVANVVVWVQPAEEGKYFKIKDDLKKLPDVEMDQPHCAFVPHVVAVFPKYLEKGVPKETGQVLKVVNNAPIGHNFKTPKKNILLGRGESTKFTFDPEDEPIKAECSVHSWMYAYIWAFNHPYFAVTRADGGFEFTAPAGAKLNIMAWHEAKKTWQVDASVTVPDGETVDLGTINPR
jgi:hypothetical protein